MSNQPTNYQTRKSQQETQIEQAFLKGNKDPALGVYQEIFSAKCGPGQDGGVVTALLIKGLERALFEAVVVVERKEIYCAQAAIARSPREISSASGTKYLRAQVIPKLRELLDQGAKHVAVVCTPCEALAIRLLQQKIGVGCEITVVGLFCFEAFREDQFKAEVKARLGVDLDNARRTQIRRGKFIAVVDGQEVSCRVKELNGAVETSCLYCADFTSRLADVSVGSVGSKTGYSTVIVRSERGAKLVGTLDCAREAVDCEEIIRLVQFKTKRAEESFALLNKRK